jgi:hypothetical protein
MASEPPTPHPRPLDLRAKRSLVQFSETGAGQKFPRNEVSLPPRRSFKCPQDEAEAQMPTKYPPEMDQRLFTSAYEGTRDFPCEGAVGTVRAWSCLEVVALHTTAWLRVCWLRVGWLRVGDSVVACWRQRGCVLVTAWLRVYSRVFACGRDVLGIDQLSAVQGQEERVTFHVTARWRVWMT